MGLQVTLGEIVVFPTNAQTLENKTLGTGTVITATDLPQTGNAKCQPTEVIRDLETTNDTPGDLFTWTITDEAVTRVDAVITAITSDGSAGASYSRSMTFRRDGGTVNNIGSVRDNATEENSAGWDVTIDNSGSTGRVRVTGAAATTIRWGGTIRRQVQVP